MTGLTTGFVHPPACDPGGPGSKLGIQRRAFTFLEMMLALTITSLIGSAVCTLIYGSLNADRFVRSTNTAQSEIELAVDRVSNNLREAQSGTIVTGTSKLSTLTQPDVVHGYPAGATVAYSLAADPNAAGQNMLVENDQRYGTNTLLHNVTTFTVAAVSGTPKLYQIDLVIGSQMTEERHFKVFTRN